MKEINIIMLWIISCVVLNGCGPKEIPLNKEYVVDSDTFSVTADKADFSTVFDYKLQPGDVLGVLLSAQVWDPNKAYKFAFGDVVSVHFPGAPTLDQIKIRVPPDGVISMPYVGIVHIQGMTNQELTNELESRYKKVLRKPNLYITVDEYLSQLASLREAMRSNARGSDRLVTIRPDGYVTFPVIGDVRTTSKSLTDIQKTANNEYRKLYENVQATIFLESHAATRVYVIGAVTTPGAFEIQKPLTVQQVLALAGGMIMGSSNTDEVIVARRIDNKVIARRIDVNAALNLEEDTKNFYVGPDDVVYVPPSRIAKAAQIAENLRKVMMFRGWTVNTGITAREILN